MSDKFHWFILIFVSIMAILVLIFYGSPFLFTIGTIELFIIAVVVTGFVVVYSRRNWRANPYGRALMYSKISLAILADLSLVTGVFGTHWEKQGILRILVFSFILIAQGRLFQLLISTKERNERRISDNVQGEYDKIHEGD